MEMYLSTSRATTERLAGHEFGHVMGLLGTEHSTNMVNLMASPAGETVTPQDIQRIIERCGPEHQQDQPAEEP